MVLSKAEVVANHDSDVLYEPNNTLCKGKEPEVVNSHSLLETLEGNEKEQTENLSRTDVLKKGLMEYG